jgi:hypothetical protein
MNKSGQILFYTLMLCTAIIVLALAFAPIIKQFISQSEVDMDCTNSSISDFNKATCYSSDISLWFYVLLFIVIAFVILGAKVIGG